MKEKIRFRAKVINAHRISIPKIERDLLGIEEGDLVEVEIRKINKGEVAA